MAESTPGKQAPEFFIRSQDPKLRQTGIFAFPFMITSFTDPETGVTRTEVHHKIHPMGASPEDIARFKYELEIRTLAMLRGEPQGNIDPNTPPSQGQHRPQIKP